jgi:RHS repeat-associated protein
VKERYAYDSYGNTRVVSQAFGARTSSDYDWEIRFSGYRWDRSAEVFHVRHRVYHNTASWIQRDPLGLAAGTNLYSYVRSRPTVTVDPDGRAWYCTTLTHPCFGNLIGCACGMIGIADVLFGLLPPTDPTLLIIKASLNIFDCICEGLDMLTTICHYELDPDCPAGQPQVLVQGLYTVAGCFLDAIGEFVGPKLGEILAVIELVLQLLEDIVADPILGAAGGVPPWWLQCGFAAGNCAKQPFKGILW